MFSNWFSGDDQQSYQTSPCKQRIEQLGSRLLCQGHSGAVHELVQHRTSRMGNGPRPESHDARPRRHLGLHTRYRRYAEGQLRVRGKGSKLRYLPLAPETTQLIDHYLRLERPSPCSAALFVVLKGPARGTRMTPAGLRSLFRYHRRTTGIQLANPHRFRHTFASDMVRAGISLPALMQLMGHSDIETTLHYVQVSPQDVYLQFARAAAQCIRPMTRSAS